MKPTRKDRLALVAACSLLLFCGCNFDPYDPPAQPQPQPPGIPDELIQQLSLAYRTRDINLFANLFPNTTDSAPYYFFLNAPVNGIDNWDVTEELRIHRRMFKPQDLLPGETPVVTQLWLASITINLSRTAATWVERTDLYKTPANPNGLDSAKWKATEAEFHADILFETQGQTDYRVDSRENFIVIQDLGKSAGAPRRFLIYRWEDLDPPPVPAQETTILTQNTAWSGVKSLYM